MIYALKNENYSLLIDSLGAELKSSKYKNEEYLHIGDEKYWKRSSPILFPIVGKLKDDKYIYKNKEYFLSQHGFARDLEFRVLKESKISLTFLLCENENTLKVYPFSFSLKIIYTLKKDSFEIAYEVKSEDDILFSLGTHPAFLLKASLDESYLEFEVNEEKDLICLDKGYISNKKNNYLSSNTLKLEKNIFKDDALIFESLKSKSIILKNNKNKKSVKILFKFFSHLGIWAPLNAPFICLEPWCGLADNINSNYDFKNKTAIIKLEKNNTFFKKLQISFT